MTPYQEFLAELESHIDPSYREFHKKLLNDGNINLLGVRVPQLRAIAKKYYGKADLVLGFPDGIYEVTFVKLAVVSRLGYEEMLKRLDGCVELIDNWALCDSFAPVSIKSHKNEFLPVIRGYLLSEREFTQRFALTTLLHFYVEEEYLETIFSAVERCDTSKYYVHMAAAWLIAETLVKYFPQAKGFMLEQSLDKKTHNKAIQKACESRRLANDDKNFLKGIKR